MELTAYEGASGGKFPRKPFRRSASTPYDRPPSAARGLRGLTEAAGSSSGWLSKLVDPASRFIAGSASRLFSTVFCKRLAAPTEVQGSELNCQNKMYLPEVADVAPTESLIQPAVDGHNPSTDFVTPGISEIEQLLKQNVLTRAQVDYLTGLIRSRTIEPSVQPSESNNEKANVSEDENRVRKTSFNRKLSTSKNALTDVAASPAEIAKAYMSSRLPKASPSTLCLQSRLLQRDKSSPSSGPYAQNLHNLSIVPRSSLHISEVPELLSAGYSTKSQGRSVMYRMSRSPYFMVNPSVNVNEKECARGSNPIHVSSQWSPERTSNFDSRQALKRNSSFLDSEDGSFGPIRRIRHKSGLSSFSNHSRFMPSSSSGSSSLLHPDKNDLKDATSSEKPRPLNELIYASTSLQNPENGDGTIFSSNLPPVSRKSSEACRKILEQLDKLAPSREERPNMRSMDELPSKLTAEMLNGRARRSMDNVDTSKFSSINVVDTSEKPNEAHENGPSRDNAPGVKFEAAKGPSIKDIFCKTSMPSISSTCTTNPVPATVHSQIKPSFQMSAPEELLELDDERDALDVSGHSSMRVLKPESKIAATKVSNFAMIVPEEPEPWLPPSKNMNVSNSVSYDVSQVFEKRSSFINPVATESGDLYTPALTPTVPSLSQDKLFIQNEQTVPPSIFGSQNSSISFSSSPAAVAKESSTEYKTDLSWPGRKSEVSNLSSDEKSGASMHRSSGIVASSDLSALGSTDAIAFSSSNTSTQSNGSVHSSSLTSLLSSSMPEVIPKAPQSLFSSNSKLMEASSSSPPMFSFGAATSTPAPVSVSLSSDKSISVDSEGKIANKSPLGSSDPITTQAASVFLSGGNNNISLMGPSPFPGSGTTLPGSNSTLAAPSNISQVSSSGSSFAPQTSSSAQASGICLSAANGSSGNSNTVFGSTGGTIFGAQLAQSGSGTSLFSQSSTIQPGYFSSSTSLVSSSSSCPSSSTFGLNSSSSPGFGQMSFTTTNQTAKSFDSSSGFSFATGPSSLSSGFSFPFSSGAVVSSSSSSFPSTASAPNFSSVLASTGSSTSSSGFSFSAGSISCSQTGNTLSPATTPGLFVSSSLCSTSSISNSLFGSSPQTGFSFGLTPSASNVSSFGFGSSSGSVFSFTSSGTSMSAATASPTFGVPSTSGGFSSASPTFGVPSTSGGFSSVSPNNHQMNVGDTMADDTNQISGPSFPAFGQPSSTPASSSFLFGSAVPSGGTSVFQFGSQQNSSILQNPNPFQAGGNLDFAPGGSFSLGSGGGEKSARKFVKVRRDKMRRK